jgi:hypothetical protein
MTYSIVDALAQCPPLLLFHVLLPVHLIHELLQFQDVSFLPKPCILSMFSIPITTVR